MCSAMGGAIALLEITVSLACAVRIQVAGVLFDDATAPIGVVFLRINKQGDHEGNEEVNDDKEDDQDDARTAKAAAGRGSSVTG